MAEEHVISYLQRYKREHPEATTVPLTDEQEVELDFWCKDHPTNWSSDRARLAPVFGTEDYADTIMQKREIYGMKF